MIKRPILKLYKYDNVKLAELHSAYAINEDKKFGEVNDLSFLYPKFLINRNKQTVLDSNGFPQDDDKADMLVNERLVLLNSTYYIIKQVSEVKTKDGFTVFEVVCKEKYSELAYKQVYKLILDPIEHDPVFATEAISDVLSYAYEKMNGTVVASSSGTVTLDTTSTIDYTGDKITIIENTGNLQQRRIASYSTSTKIATLDSNWTTLPDTTSKYRVHNSQYKLGTVDSLLLNDGTSDILRGFRFSEISVLDALLEIAERFGGYITTTATYNSTYDEYENIVNLVLSISYNNVEFRYGKNLNGITRVVDSSSGCFTRLSPVGRNDLRINSVASVNRSDPSSSGLVTYAEHEYGQSEMFNFQYYIADDYSVAQCKKNFVKDYKFVNEGYSDADLLYDGAKKSLEDLSVPKVTYVIESLDLSVLSNYAYLDYDIGQTVRVVDRTLNMSFYATVYKKSINYDNPQSPKTELSNFFDNFGGYLNRIIKYNNNFTQDKKKYGKGNTVIIADELTSRNWRYADYVIPTDGRYTASEIIQKAIDDISTNTDGGTIQLLEGTYYLDTTLTLEDNIILKGSGAGTLVYPTKDGITFAITSHSTSNTEIQYINIQYVSDGAGGVLYRFENGVGANYSDNFCLDNMIISYVYNNYYISQESSTISVYDNIIYDDDLGDTSDNTDVIDLKDCTDCSIYSNTIKTISFRTISIAKLYTDYIIGTFNIYNNYIYCESFWGAISVQGTNPLPTEVYSSIKIYDNEIYNTTEISIGAIVLNYCYPCDVYGNTIDTIGLRAIYIVNSKGIKVKNNAIACSGGGYTTGAAVKLTASSDCDVQLNNIKKDGIIATSSATEYIAYGIEVGSGSSNNIVANNDLADSGVTAPFLDSGTNTNILGGNKLV